MTDKEYVIRVAKFMKIDVHPSTKKVAGVYAVDFTRKVNGVYPCVIDAASWKDAREQLDAYRYSREADKGMANK